MRIVIDTNVMIAAVSRRSPYRRILDQLLIGSFELYLSTEILLEYNEVMERFYSREVANSTLSGILFLNNVFRVETYYNLRLIENDEDDNKFADCAFASNAHYLVTNDRDYNILKTVVFPRINLLKGNEFLELLS